MLVVADKFFNKRNELLHSPWIREKKVQTLKAVCQGSGLISGPTQLAISISVLIRGEDKVKVFEDLGVQTFLFNSLDELEMLQKAASVHDGITTQPMLASLTHNLQLSSTPHQAFTQLQQKH